MKNCMNKQENRNAKSLHYIVTFAAVLLLTLVFAKPGIASATAGTGTRVGVVVNYADETAIITSSNGSTKFFISTDKGRNWEGIDGNIVDISPLLKTKEADVWFKGDKDTLENQYKLMAEPNDLKVDYTVTNGAGYLTITPLTSGTTVEFRKGTNGNWKTASLSMPTSLYELKGDTLYFRTVATANRRSSKIIQKRINKRPNAPSARLDGSRLYISGIKPGEAQYRVGATAEWTTFSSAGIQVRYISLYDILANKVISNQPLPAGTIEFRNIATDKKPVSAVKLIEIAQQLTCPEVFTVTGSTITINDYTARRVYEYTIVPRNSTYDVTTARWSTISMNRPYKVPKVAVGDRVLIRIRSSIDPNTKQIILASTFKDILIQSITP